MKIIAHLDLDAFFAAVEEHDKPRLKGRPIVVGADPEGGRGRGVVSTANYAARTYGIHSAMPISKAWLLAKAAEAAGKPSVVFMGGSHPRYAKISQRVMDIVRSYAPHIEQASVDEAYLDLSHTAGFDKAVTICQKLKKEIRVKEGLTASIGLGPNKLIAKIASDMQKPDGLTVVKESQAEGFLAPLPIRKIPGIGPKTEAFLKKENVQFVADLKPYSREQLVRMMGRWGDDLYDKIRGIDNSSVVEEHEAKSIGEQETFRYDTTNPADIFPVFRDMAERIVKSMHDDGFVSFRAVAITVRFSDFETKTRIHTLKPAGASPEKIYSEAMKLFLPFLDIRENPHKKPFRLVGIRIEKLA